jgi:hypothetical protein
MSETRYNAEDLKRLPLRAVVAFAVRCARRVEHLTLPPDDHPEREELRSAVVGALRLAEDFARGLPSPAADPAVRAVEAGQSAAQGDLMRENAYAAVVRTAHAAATAMHAIALREEPEERRLVSGDPPPQILPHLADLSADLAALGAFTAAMDAAEALASPDDFRNRAAEDYRKLLGLKLGQYPEAGQPIDPSPEGPLGPLGSGAPES